jgi:hypothetical protein
VIVERRLRLISAPNTTAAGNRGRAGTKKSRLARQAAIGVQIIEERAWGRRFQPGRGKLGGFRYESFTQ